MSFKKYLSLFGLLAIMAPLVIAQEEAEDEDVEEVVVTGIKTVSYTHLTLPTNREV